MVLKPTILSVDVDTRYSQPFRLLEDVKKLCKALIDSQSAAHLRYALPRYPVVRCHTRDQQLTNCVRGVLR